MATLHRWWARGVPDEENIEADDLGPDDNAWSIVSPLGPGVVGRMLVIGSQATAQYVRRNLDTGVGDHAIRWYYRLDATPTATVPIFIASSGTAVGSGGQVWGFTVTTGRVLQLRSAANSAVRTGPTLTLGVWYRIEVSRDVETSTAQMRVWSLDTNPLDPDRVETPTGSYANASIGSAALAVGFQWGHITSARSAAAYGLIDLVDTEGIIGPYVEPEPDPEPPTGPAFSLWTDSGDQTLAYIGDSLTWQDGAGPTDIPASLVAKGWDPDSIYLYAVSGKRLIDEDSNGFTGQESVDAARTALGGEPNVWVIALGTNDRHYGGATIASNISTLLSYLGTTSDRIIVVGVSLQTTDAAQTRANDNIRPAVQAHDGGEWLDFDTYIKAQPQTGLWDNDGIHMEQPGYDLKNAWIADAVGPPVGNTEIPVSVTEVWVNGALVPIVAWETVP